MDREKEHSLDHRVPLVFFFLSASHFIYFHLFHLNQTMRGELKSVSSLFDKYKKTLIAPQGTVIKEFLDLLEDMFAVKVEKGRVSYNPSTKVLMINGLGPLRSEVRMREGEVLAHLKGRLGEKNAPKRLA